MLTLLLSCVIFIYLSIAIICLLLVSQPFRNDGQVKVDSEPDSPSWSELLTTSLFWPVTLFLFYRVSPLNPQNFEPADTRAQEPNQGKSTDKKDLIGQKQEKLS